MFIIMEVPHFDIDNAILKTISFEITTEKIIRKVRQIVDKIPQHLTTEEGREWIPYIHDTIARMYTSMRPVLDYPLPSFPQLKIELEEINLKMAVIRQQVAMMKTGNSNSQITENEENVSDAEINGEQLENTYSPDEKGRFSSFQKKNEYKYSTKNQEEQVEEIDTDEEKNAYTYFSKRKEEEDEQEFKSVFINSAKKEENEEERANTVEENYVMNNKKENSSTEEDNNYIIVEELESSDSSEQNSSDEDFIKNEYELVKYYGRDEETDNDSNSDFELSSLFPDA